MYLLRLQIAYKRKIANQLSIDSIKLWSVQADNTVFMDQVKIGDGAALSPFVDCIKY
jgi:hypothetical protein